MSENMRQVHSSTHQTLHERMMGDEGGVRRNVVIGVSAGAAVLGGLYFASQRLFGGLPEQVAAPEDSKVTVETLAIVPEDITCNALTLFDTSGSTARTKYDINVATIGGYGATMTEGVVKMETCAESPDITTEMREIDGKKVKFVVFKRDSMVFDSSFIDSETLIVQSNPPETQILGGAVDILSGGAELLCKGYNKIPINDKVDCSKVRILSSWNDTDEAELQRALRVAVLEQAQQKCGALEWKNQTVAIGDAYKRQAVAAGLPPESVEVEFQDENGDPTTEAPNFTKSAIDKLYEKGILTEDSEGAPKIEFDEMTCTPMSEPYVSEFAPSNR